jgi:glucokinase
MFVGIDVGGTNLKAGLVDETGRLLAVERTALNFQGPEAFAGTLAHLTEAAAEKGGMAPEALEYVGIGLPGAVDGGEVLFTTNIPMEHIPLERLFRRYLDRPLLLGNDADCAAVGEYFCGAGRGTRDFAVVTLGTGIGAGLVVNGKLRGGRASSEAGHLVICHEGEPCNCGRRGCWERYASATALIRLTGEAMAAHPESALHAIAAASGGVEGSTAFDAAQAGDETALAVCRRYVEYLADGAVSLINILRPEVLAIGGGIAGAPEALLMEPLQEIAARECFACHGGTPTRIVKAELGNDAGILGAALLGRAI